MAFGGRSGRQLVREVSDDASFSRGNFVARCSSVFLGANPLRFRRGSSGIRVACVGGSGGRKSDACLRVSLMISTWSTVSNVIG